MMFQIKQYMLPHDGNIPGGGPRKKEIIPAGTKVFCIVYGTKIYWAAYLDEAQAITVARSLEATTRDGARRQIPVNTLLAWNFKDRIPTRIVRKKDD